MNISDEIKRLHELHQAGALSTAEFEQAKAKLLNASVELNKPSFGAHSGSGHSGPGDFGAEISRLRASRSARGRGRGRGLWATGGARAGGSRSRGEPGAV